MSSPYVGEIRMFGGNFAPAGWAFCAGQLLPISENPTLFDLIGTTYGGDGQNTFGLPNLQSRVPMHVGNGFSLGDMGGSESVTLTISTMPEHNHVPQCSASAGTESSPTGNAWAGGSGEYAGPPASSSLTLAPQAIGSSGGSQPHDNMLPFVAVSFIISLFGVFPSQS
jgi:microcystin-dependent protein